MTDQNPIKPKFGSQNKFLDNNEVTNKFLQKMEQQNIKTSEVKTVNDKAKSQPVQMQISPVTSQNKPKKRVSFTDTLQTSQKQESPVNKMIRDNNIFKVPVQEDIQKQMQSYRRPKRVMLSPVKQQKSTSIPQFDDLYSTEVEQNKDEYINYIKSNIHTTKHIDSPPLYLQENKEMNNKSSDAPNVQLPDRIDQVALLNSLKIQIPLNSSYKRLLFNFQTHLQNRHTILHSIYLLQLDVAQKFSVQIEKYYSQFQQPTPLQLQKYYLLKLKQFVKINKLKKKLINSVISSEIQIKLALAFKFMRFISYINNIKYTSDQSSIKRTYFSKLHQIFQLRQADLKIADQIAIRQKQAFCFTFLQVQRYQNDLEILTDRIYATKTQNYIFQTIKAFVLRQLIQKQKLLGNDNIDFLFENSVKEILQIVKEDINDIQNLVAPLKKKLDGKYVRSWHVQPQVYVQIGNTVQVYQKCTCTCNQQQEVMGLMINTCAGCSCQKCKCKCVKLTVSQLALTNGLGKSSGQFQLKSMVKSMTMSKLNIFKTPNVPLVVMNDQQQYKKQIIFQRVIYYNFKATETTKLMYLSKNKVFSVQQLNPQLLSYLKQQPIYQAVDIQSNLFLMAKALHSLKLAHKRQLFYNMCKERGVDRFKKLFLLQFKTNILKIREQEKTIIEQFQTRHLLNKTLQTLKVVYSQDFSSEQIRKSDRMFKIIIVRRQMQAWSKLIKQLKVKYSKMQILVSNLQRITVYKPVFQAWLCLTQIITETREKRVRIQNIVEERLVKQGFDTWIHKTNKRLVLRNVVSKALERYENKPTTQDIAQMVFSQLKVQATSKLSLKNIAKASNLRVKAIAWHSWTKQHNQNQICNVFIQETKENLLYQTFSAIVQRYQQLQQLKTSIDEQQNSGKYQIYFNKLRFYFKLRNAFNPLLQYKIVSKWRLSLQFLTQIDAYYNDKLLKRIIYSLNQAKLRCEIQHIVDEKYNFRLKKKAALSWFTLFHQKTQELKTILGQMDIAADQHFVQKLQFWASGQSKLLTPERLLKDTFAVELQYNNRELAVKFQKLYELTLQQQAFNMLKYIIFCKKQE
ncbi:Conserved_hypothetical protein [Hexamita inflata]|uniref:Uncharacterized protein n=1 Tax=Hexamita inflata TaxID=28002 RepID=A0AA86TZN3_9EUKA|nr:Conserved hypothetical protein [Hexamita inflata]